MNGDLISREQIARVIKAIVHEPGVTDDAAVLGCMVWNAVRTMQAVDAAPVVHGRWILKTCWGADGALIVTAECSEGCEVVREIWRGYFIDVPEHIAEHTALSKAKMAHLSNYCPDCGAKMDLE